MLSKGQKVIMFILGMVGLLVGVVVAIPFRAVPGLNQIEGIFKTEVILKIALSVLALALIIYPLVKKYKLLHDYRNACLAEAKSLAGVDTQEPPIDKPSGD